MTQKGSREMRMKTWLPPVCLLITLLANVAERTAYSNFLQTRTADSVYEFSGLTSLLVFLSTPISLAILWCLWRPTQDQRAAMPRLRVVLGRVLCTLTIIIWMLFLYRALFCAWATATPVPDVLFWQKKYALMTIYAAATLGFGGLLSLWVLGVRPPKWK